MQRNLQRIFCGQNVSVWKTAILDRGQRLSFCLTIYRIIRLTDIDTTQNVASLGSAIG